MRPDDVGLPSYPLHTSACTVTKGPQNGPPILLIHGFGASVGHFRKNIPVLAGEGYRVYAIDLLGFGASDKPKDVEVRGGEELDGRVIWLVEGVDYWFFLSTRR